MRTFFLLLFSSVCLLSYAERAEIILTPKGPAINRDGFPLYFDIPVVYYDDNPKNPEIIIDGGGAVSYYDVVITSAATNAVEISTQVNGTYDTFSVSSLTPGTHVITIESASGNTYEGTFTTY